MNPLLAHIIMGMQQHQSGQGQESWGQIDPNRYTGQVVQPQQDQGYFMNLFDPNKYMGQQGFHNQMNEQFPQRI